MILIGGSHRFGEFIIVSMLYDLRGTGKSPLCFSPGVPIACIKNFFPLSLKTFLISRVLTIIYSHPSVSAGELVPGPLMDTKIHT